MALIDRFPLLKAFRDAVPTQRPADTAPAGDDLFRAQRATDTLITVADALELADVVTLARTADLEASVAALRQQVAALQNGTGDRTSPVVAITAPTSGATVQEVVTVRGTVSDDVAVRDVRVFAGSTNLGTAAIDAAAGTWELRWPTAAGANGAVTLLAVATDTSGNESRASITTTVDNSVQVGQFSAAPSWVNTTALAGPMDVPDWTPTRSYTLPNLPASGRDITSAWNAAFGSSGSVQHGDEVLIPAGTWLRSNLDIRKEVVDASGAVGRYRIKFGTASTSAPATFESYSDTEHSLRVYSKSNVHAVSAVKGKKLGVFRALGVAGRGDKNEGGMATLALLGAAGFRGQDLLFEGARAAGFFAYVKAVNYLLNRVRFAGSKADAIHNAGGSSYGAFVDCESDDHGDDGVAIVHYDKRDSIDAQPHHIEVHRHRVGPNAHGRGLAVIAGRDVFVRGLDVTASAAAGIIVDPEVPGGSNARVVSQNVLIQDVRLSGCNWHPKVDHGSVFCRNPTTETAVTNVVMESVTIRDAHPLRSAIRVLGPGTFSLVMRDFTFLGGKSSSPTVGGNNVGSNVTTSGFNETGASTSAVSITPPSLVFETPGERATISGTLAGGPKNADGSAAATDATYLMTNKEIQGKAGDTRGLARVVVTLRRADGSGATTTLLDKTSGFDDNGAFSVPSFASTSVADGEYVITGTAYGTSGLSTTKSVRVAVLNTVATAPTPTPTGGRPSVTAAPFFDNDAVASGTVGASAAGLYDSTGNGRHFVQPSTALQPLVVAGPRSGQKAVQLEGAYLRLAASGIAAGQQRVTVAMVVRFDGQTGLNRPGVISAAAAGADDWNQTTGAWNSSAPRLSTDTALTSGTVGGSVVATNDSAYTPASPVPFGRWVLMEWEVGTDGSPALVRVDGVQVGSLSGRTLSAGLALASWSLASRTYANGFLDRSRISVTRLMAWPGGRSTTERSAVLEWARTTYGVAST
ncbi:Ig-like domain-containing protein [Pseudokineococcus lusitanus]|uniref:Uncharacterized protein n=1 Tax=Pseudokineococcus lusitanus TaxID=763993 RepID=A0A3N1HU16_9ACTN|nr:Ig-like domain-containing protein [Pseudokineococcus lusitanus]ROP45959.1 hypothetical protein EDC03_0575 [Pseudokineococcus lusitanus]